MLTHESRQLPSWLIFDVGQKMARLLAKFDITVLPALTVIALVAPRAVHASIPLTEGFYLSFVLAFVAWIHGTFVLRKDKRLFRVSCLAGGAWLVLSFLPIWFGHTSLGFKGAPDYHRHTFWDGPHVH